VRRLLPLPDFAEDLAADTFATSLTASHDALRGGHDGDAQATLNAANLVTAKINSATGTGDALQIADDGLIVGAILKINADNLHAVLFGRLVVRDVALLLEDAGNLAFELGGSFILLHPPFAHECLSREPAGMSVSGSTSRLLHHKLTP
jgi:hypothetical protein